MHEIEVELLRDGVTLVHVELLLDLVLDDLGGEHLVLVLDQIDPLMGVLEVLLGLCLLIVIHILALLGSTQVFAVVLLAVG